MAYEIEDLPEGFNLIPEYNPDPSIKATIRMEPYLAANLLFMLHAEKGKNGDILGVIDGLEGTGKSTFARQIAKLLDPTFTEKDIYYTPEELMASDYQGLPKDWNQKSLMRGEYPLKPWKCKLLDESKADVDRKKTMTTASQKFMSFLSQCRQTHGIKLIVLPGIHDLDKYVAQHRARFLVHCYVYKGYQMGYFRYYNRAGIRELFEPKNHQRRLYNAKPAFGGRFNGKEVVDLEAYDLRKAAAFERFRPDQGTYELKPGESAAELRRKWEYEVVERVLQLGLPSPTIYKALGIDNRRWNDMKKNVKRRLNYQEPEARRSDLSDVGGGGFDPGVELPDGVEPPDPAMDFSDDEL